MTKILIPIILITNIYVLNLSAAVCNGIGQIKYVNATYIGECTKNKKDGRGRIVFRNGEKYEGSWKNDKKNGHGTQHYVNGMIYSGEWKNNVYNGKGILKYNSKEKYDGTWKMGKKYGKGKYTYKNGAVYDGAWKNNKKNGYGVFRYANGIEYKGNFVNNIKQGKGSIIYKSGDKYTGGFKKAKQHGYGVFTFVKGGSYAGNWVMGKRTGKGKYIYKSGAIYDGSWINNKKEGQGKYIDSKGSVYTGLFKANKKNGQGVLKYKSGEIYEGQWKADKKDGHGTLTYKDGVVYDGTWSNDKKDGRGSRHSQYGTCHGTWKRGELQSLVEKYTYGDAYKQFNDIRLSAGMLELYYNPILQASAQNHSDYITLHHESIHGMSYHNEKEGLSGFTGTKAKDRAVKAGYFSTSVGEGISNYCNAQQSINSLMTAIYHRFGILTFDKTEVGIGFTKDSTSLKHNLVHNTGNANLNTLCQGDSAWVGNYFEKVCADKTMKIKQDPYNDAKNKVRKKNPKYVIWPVDGSVDNLYYFKDEVPDPLPNYKVTGNPISIQFNPYYFPEDLVVYSFRLFIGKKEVKETKLLTKQTDPNKKFDKNEYALFPLKPLKRDTQYRVVIKYKYKGNSKRISTSFRTMQ